MSSPEPEEPEVFNRAFDKRMLGRILAFARPYKLQIGFGLISLVLISFAQNIIPQIVRVAINKFIDGGDGLAQADKIAGLTRLALIAGAIAIGLCVVRALQGYLFAWIGQHVVNDLRREVFDKILRLHLRFFDQIPVGKLLTRITSDLDALQRFVADGMIGLVANLLLLLGVMGFMLYTDWKIALLLFLLLPAIVGFLSFINHFSRKAHRKVRDTQSAMNAHLQENITGMLTVQLHNRQEHCLDTFDERNDGLLDAHDSVVAWNTWYFPGLKILDALATCLILFACGLIVLANRADVGMVVAFLMYARDFFRPLEELSDKIQQWPVALASAEKVFRLMDEPEVVLDPPEPVPIERFCGEIEFDKVSFAYDGKDFVIRDLSFHARPGESIALVGATGAGKTSIISLLARFYDVQQGSVKVDGHDVRDYEQSELRRRVGIVLQDPFIFSGSVADNITMNNPVVTKEMIVESAKFVNAHGFIQRLPKGYQTELGERGATLSTGQKQLLALARAIVQDPDILLILDEATANVDTETEQLIQEALEKLMQGRTTVVIAHRLSTIKDVDRILVMKQGRLIESGSHGELLKEGGYYRTLFELLSHQR